MIEVTEELYIRGHGYQIIKGVDVQHACQIREQGIALVMGWA